MGMTVNHTSLNIRFCIILSLTTKVMFYISRTREITEIDRIWGEFKKEHKQ